MRQINLRLDPALLERLEDARGRIPRNRWLTGAVTEAVERYEAYKQILDPSPTHEEEEQ